MAMSAEQYLSSLPAAEQGQVRASLASSGSSVDQWFQAAVDAGDPRAVKAAGGTVAEGGGSDDVIGDFSKAKPSSEWLGKRNPTPAELRRWAKETGQSEDYARFSDRQLAAWVGSSWKGDHFENDFGDRVEKPTESGANSQAAGYATGEKSAGTRGGGGGAYNPPATADPTANPNDPLQSRLLEMFGGGEGAFAGDRAVGQDLAGGGVWWSGQDNVANDAPGVNPALAQATLTAFTPNAPSQRQNKPTATSSSFETAPVPAVNSAVVGGEIGRPAAPTTVPGAVPRMPQTAPGAGGDILSQAVQRRFRDPNSWWMGQ